MGTFEIQYTKATPSGKIPNVRANLDLDAGEQDVGRAIGQAGGALFDVGMKIRTAQDAMALSELNRQSSEMDIALHESLSKMTDEDAQNKLIEEAYAGKQKLAASTNQRVGKAFTIGLNNSYGAWKSKAMGTALQARAKDVLDQLQFQYQDALSRGDIKEANKILQLGRATGVLTPSAVQAMSSTSNIDSILLQAQKNIYSDDPTNVKIGSELLASVDESKMTVGQLEKKRQLGKVSMTAMNIKYQETEKELHRKFIEGTLTIAENDNLFLSGASDVQTHKAYDSIIKNKEVLATDSILAEKWLNNELTEDDIKLAQQERNLNSDAVAAWMHRLDTGQFSLNVYDEALTKIREVQFNKGKYDEVRLWLLQNASDLDGKWDDVRNRLETAMNVKGDSVTAGPSIRRAHSYLDDYFDNNPDLNDGSLESIRRKQAMHDTIDARADYTPDQMRDLTQALLLPYEEEKAKGWFSDNFDIITKHIPAAKYHPITLYMSAREKRAKLQAMFKSKMLIRPISGDDFKKEIILLKGAFGDDSKEVKQFYNRYVDDYDWGDE